MDSSMDDASPDYEEVRIECGPLKTVKELLEWEYVASKHPFTPADLRKHFRLSSDHGEVMLIHDMKGGYLDDRFVLGNNNNDAFRFYHWHLIDWFVYFAHDLVTIPPPGWIHVAHKNGVPVLGTFITEWKDGEAALEEILASDDHVEAAVEQLLRICYALNFDGWFVNIENPVRTELLPRLIRFLELLYAGGILVVWYDSVTTSGELKWQDQFNKLNYPFAAALYKAEDSLKRGRIFLNYTWKPHQLDESIRFANEKGYRASCVHVGIDVFGRGCLGGGGMNCNVALREIWKRPPLSIGLFAPGWVFETQPETQDRERHLDLFQRTVEFWGLIQELLGGPRKITGDFHTDFSLGQGPLWFNAGRQLVGAVPTNDMRAQATLPHFYPCSNAPYKIEIDRSMALDGSNSLRIEVRSLEPVVVPMFATWRPSDQLMQFEVITRFPKSGPSQDDRVLALVVKCRNQDVDVEETPEVKEKRQQGKTTPDEDLYRVIVIAIMEAPALIRKQLLDKIRIHCLEHERIDQLCPMLVTHLDSRPIDTKPHHDRDRDMEDWFVHSMDGFGTPGSLTSGRSMAYEMGLLLWDLRHRPSAAAQFDRYTHEPTDPMWLLVNGMRISWFDNGTNDERLYPYSRDGIF